MNQRFFLLLLSAWTLIIQICSLRLNTLFEANPYEELQYPPTENENSKGQTPLRLPSLSNLENTFIVRIMNFQRSFFPDPIRIASIKWVHSVMKVFEKDANKFKINFFYNYVYYFGFQGFSISLEYPEHIKIIEERREFYYIKEIFNDHLVYQNELDVSSFPKLVMGLPLGAANQYLNGKDIKAAVIDSGIPFNSNKFIIPGKTCVQLQQEGCRVKRVHDFVAEAELLKVYNEYPPHEPGYDENNRPYTSHGASMAALIGGTDENAPGIAQEIDFFDYRVIDENGSTPLSRVTAALSLALYHGVDIVCLSLGIPDGTNFRLSNYMRDADDTKDVIVLTSIGNFGPPNHLFYVNSIASSQSVITVSSFSNPFKKVYRIEIDWNHDIIGIGVTNTHAIAHPLVLEDEFSKLLNMSLDIGGIFLTEEKRLEEIKTSVPFIFFNDLIGLIMCDSQEHCLRLLNAFIKAEKFGAFVFITQAVLISEAFIDFDKPVAHVPHYVFNFRQLLDVAFLSIHLHPHYLLLENTPIIPSSGSSLGPNNDLESKPDVAVIGSPLLTYTGNNPNLEPGVYDHPYVFLGGTSNANALGVGFVGLLLSNSKAMGKSLSFDDVLMRLHNTAFTRAYPTPMFNPMVDPEDIFMYSVYEQGSGLLQAEAMLTSLAHIYPSKIDLKSILPSELAKDRLALEVPITIENTGLNPIFYFLTHNPGTSFHLNINTALYDRQFYKMKISFLDIRTRTQLKTISVGANSTFELLVQFRISKETPLFAFLNGYLKFTPITLRQNENGPESVSLPTLNSFRPLSVPYSCLYGDIHQLPTISNTGPKRSFLANVEIHEFNELLTISNLFDFNGLPIYSDTTALPKFTLKEEDKPVISMCLFFSVKTLRFSVIDHLTNINLGVIETYKKIFQGCYLFFLNTFDPLLHGKPVPNHWDMSTAGWNGLYVSQRSSQIMQIEEGKSYRICAKIEKQTRIRKKSSLNREVFDWCSILFTV